jgi:hypothetical protein
MFVSDHDVFLIARLLLREKGLEAVSISEAIARNSHEFGDFYHARVWSRVFEKMKEMVVTN